MKATSMNVTFSLHTVKKDDHGKCPIYARITINGKRLEFSIKRKVSPEVWISNPGTVKGRSEEAKSLNSYMRTVENKLNECYRRLLEKDLVITAERIKNEYFGISEKGKTILEAFEYHNSQMKDLVGNGYAPATYERYLTTLSHIQEFLNYKSKLSDLELKSVNYQFVSEFEHYLRHVRSCNKNTTNKYLGNLRKIVLKSISLEWMDKNPFAGRKLSIEEVKREYLTKEEINSIVNKKFSSSRLEVVKDVFLFCCFTGLAYADVEKLSPNHIVRDMEGNRMIEIARTKTGSISRIPLLEIPLSLIEKYAIHPVCIDNKRILPVSSNQKMNEYLKEIGTICGITKSMTSHLARHTYATLCLTHGVDIVTVSTMLGHKNLKQTQHYAKMTTLKLNKDMDQLRGKFPFQAGG